MSTLTSLNAANLTIASRRVSLWTTLPNHRRGWCTILLLVGWRAAVTWCSMRLLLMGESNAEQRNDDEEDIIPHTMCSEEPDTSSGESPLRESLQHSGSIEDERDMHSGETPRPRYNLRSTAAPQQCVPSPRCNLRSTGASGDGWTAGSAAAIKSASSPILQEPVSYKQALRSPQSGEWEAAI
jgi:hypothetical protein